MKMVRYWTILQKKICRSFGLNKYAKTADKAHIGHAKGFAAKEQGGTNMSVNMNGIMETYGAYNKTTGKTGQSKEYGKTVGKPELSEDGKKYYEDLGIPSDHLRYHDHEKLAHYAKAACDIEFLFPFGWGEINGTHNRTNFDLTRHQEYSGQKMDYLDPVTGEKYIPYIIESTYGLDRTVLALLCEAYDEEVIDAEKNDVRTVLHLNPAIAPYKAAVLPLSKKLSEKAMEVRNELSRYFMTDFDETGSIGKRYRRQDEVGTPYCITFDFQSETDGCVTVRDRDTMEQERIKIEDIAAYISGKISF